MINRLPFTVFGEYSVSDPRSAAPARRCLAFAALLLLRTASGAEWLDSFYDVRIPVTLTAPEAGDYVLDIDPAEVLPILRTI